MKKIDSFRGEYEFLSNFSYSPFIYKDIFYPTVEHYFQASKATTLAKHKEIARATTPSQAKWLGRRTQLRSDWQEVRDEVMEVGLRQKFEQNPELLQKLLDTGDAYLEEGNHWHDNTWGNCSCARCKDKEGKNYLGKLLMKIREENK